ncbi:MAG TPA: hypothetical protein VEL76_42380, partial [Gemmataceae bacterium]|nr:hypothetical protein [Gemmataceae bacterium]
MPRACQGSPALPLPRPALFDLAPGSGRSLRTSWADAASAAFAAAAPLADTAKAPGNGLPDGYSLSPDLVEELVADLARALQGRRSPLGRRS